MPIRYQGENREHVVKKSGWHVEKAMSSQKASHKTNKQANHLLEFHAHNKDLYYTLGLAIVHFCFWFSKAARKVEVLCAIMLYLIPHNWSPCKVVSCSLNTRKTEHGICTHPYWKISWKLPLLTKKTNPLTQSQPSLIFLYHYPQNRSIYWVRTTHKLRETRIIPPQFRWNRKFQSSIAVFL